LCQNPPAAFVGIVLKMVRMFRAAVLYFASPVCCHRNGRRSEGWMLSKLNAAGMFTVPALSTKSSTYCLM